MNIANTNNITFSVRDFRAVQSADIHLNGITVVSGINGSGKSTLSKMIYHSVENIVNFDKVIKEEVYDEIKATVRLLERIHDRIQVYYVLTDENEITTWDATFSLFNPSARHDLEICRQYIDYLRVLLSIEDDEQAIRISRFASVLHFIDKSDFTVEKGLDALINKIQAGITSLNNISEITESRPAKRFIETLQVDFRDFASDNLSIEELGAKIAAPSNSKIGKLFTLNKAVYLDSPMIVGVSFQTKGKSTRYWSDFNNLLRSGGESPENVNSVTNLVKETIQGEPGYDERISTDLLIYKRNDGKEFELEQCATGVRAFSAIQLLLNNGVIDEDTLLIIDEPEAHLHPQWIVEYARLIVKMNRELGVKFFITSHSTDMISALKYINNKEGHKSNLTFYNAEPSEKDPFKFVYKNLGTNIEPIFESFNKSFDKIEEYGQDDA